jgi:hypothetical protein
MRTHVSMDGVLYRVGRLVEQHEIYMYGGDFLGYGRHVNPAGNYQGAPIVCLYRVNGGFLAC